MSDDGGARVAGDASGGKRGGERGGGDSGFDCAPRPALVFPAEILARLAAVRVVAGFSVGGKAAAAAESDGKLTYADSCAREAVAVARALLAGGIDVVEITLRPPAAALAGVAAIAAEVPEMLIGVGTILTPEHARAAKEAGAHFGVAPGCNARVVAAAREIGLPFAPGVATPSDIETAVWEGCRLLKVFPGVPLGGARYLKSMSAPYRHLGLRYFPLGGVHEGNMGEFLAMDDVIAVGGSWIVKAHGGDWAGVTRKARAVRDALDDV